MVELEEVKSCSEVKNIYVRLIGLLLNRNNDGKLTFGIGGSNQDRLEIIGYIVGIIIVIKVKGDLDRYILHYTIVTSKVCGLLCNLCVTCYGLGEVETIPVDPACGIFNQAFPVSGLVGVIVRCELIVDGTGIIPFGIGRLDLLTLVFTLKSLELTLCVNIVSELIIIETGCKILRINSGFGLLFLNEDVDGKFTLSICRCYIDEVSVNLDLNGNILL